MTTQTMVVSLILLQIRGQMGRAVLLCSAKLQQLVGELRLFSLSLKFSVCCCIHVNIRCLNQRVSSVWRYELYINYTNSVSFIAHVLSYRKDSEKLQGIQKAQGIIK